jgi:hypothetical protein
VEVVILDVEVVAVVRVEEGVVRVRVVVVLLRVEEVVVVRVVDVVVVLKSETDALACKNTLESTANDPVPLVNSLYAAVNSAAVRKRSYTKSADRSIFA